MFGPLASTSHKFDQSQPKYTWWHELDRANYNGWLTGNVLHLLNWPDSPLLDARLKYDVPSIDGRGGGKHFVSDANSVVLNLFYFDDLGGHTSATTMSLIFRKRIILYFNQRQLWCWCHIYFLILVVYLLTSHQSCETWATEDDTS